ncbi:MAG: carbohydrate kinase [Prevotella sp.]|nr:carbohydrate kinase [Candidatus Prevotella equi]
MSKIIGIGETILDIIFKNDQPLKAVPGGSTFNALISIGRTGTPCVMVTETGDDHVGDIISSFLKENNVSADFVYRHAGTQSHVSLAFLNERNDAQYSFYKHHGALAMPEAMPEVNEGDVVIYGSFYAINPVIRDYTRRFLRMAKDKGAILYYDINFRASHIKDLPDTMGNIIENIQLATIVRGSSEDFSVLFGCDDVDEVYSKYIAPHCPLFIYTNADKPVQLRTPSYNAEYPAKPIETVSTIGAGDNFNAGFCYAVYKEGLSDLSALTEQQWARLIAKGQEFSSEVCQSLDNYIAVRKQ